MTISPMLDPAMRELRAELTRMKQEIDLLKRGQRSLQLDYSSIEAGAVTINDENGNPQLLLGLQDDGTYAAVHLNGTDPAAPSNPLVSPGIGGLYVIWDGLMQDASDPLSDFDYVQIHVSQTEGFTPDQTTLVGRLAKPGMYAVGSLQTGVPYFIVLVPVNKAGVAGDVSNEATATPTAVPDNIGQDQITGVMIGDGEVTGRNIAANTITADHIVAGTIVSGIVDATVVNAAIFNGSVFNGSNFTLDTFGERYYTTFPAAGNLRAAISPVGYTDAFGNVIPSGYLSQLGTAQVIIDNAMVKLSSDSINYTIFQADAAGYAQVTSAGGLVQNISGTHPANISPATITTTGVHDIGSPVTISDKDTETGAVFEWYATGSFTTGATAPTSATFTFQVAGTARATLAIPGTIQNNLTNAGWWCKARVSIINGTASGQISTLLEVGWHTGAGVIGSAYYFVVNGDTPSLGTPRSMGLQFQWGTAPGSTALNPDIQTYGRIA